MRLNSICYNKYDFQLPSSTKLNYLVLIIFIFATLQPAASRATAPRTSAFGGDNTYLEDDSNVLRWYGSLSDYGNQVIIGTGHHDLSAGIDEWSNSPSGIGTGIHLNLDSHGKWGTAAFFFNDHMRDSDISNSLDEDAENSWTMMYGRKIGPLQIGLALRTGSLERDVAVDTIGSVPSAHREFSRTTLSFGIRTDLSATSYLDVAADVRRLNWVEAESSIQELPDSWNNFNIRTRAFFSAGPNIALVPALEYWSEDYSALVDWSAYATPSRNKKMLRLGCGLNYFPHSDNFMLLSADYRRFKDDREEFPQIAYNQVHLFQLLMATETRWNHWLTLRGSVGCQYSRFPTDLDGYENIDDSAFPISVGAGLHLGEFDMDLAMTSHEPGLLAPNWSTVLSDGGSYQKPGSWFSASLRYLF